MYCNIFITDKPYTSRNMVLFVDISTCIIKGRVIKISYQGLPMMLIGLIACLELQTYLLLPWLNVSKTSHHFVSVNLQDWLLDIS